MQNRVDEVINDIALTIKVIGPSNIKTLDLGSPKNKSPIIITFNDEKISPVVIADLDEPTHREVFDTILGSAVGKNNKFTFHPKPLVMTIIDCPNLAKIDLCGGFAIIIREESPFEKEVKVEQKPKREERDPSPSSFLSKGFGRGWLLPQNTSNTSPASPAAPSTQSPKP